MRAILSLGRPSLADRVIGRSFPLDLVLITAGAALAAIVAQVQVTSWPVPLTAQTLAAMLIGSFLGCLRGAASMVVYVALGAFGLPVFAQTGSGLQVLAGPTGGYILGFVITAAVTGWMAQQAWDRRFGPALLSSLLGTAAGFAVALPWLSITAGLDLTQTLSRGLYPFFIPALIKMVLAAAIIAFAWRKIDQEDAQKAERDFLAGSLEHSFNG